MIQGECLRASLKSYLTLLEPTPTYISSKSDPEQNIKFTPDSAAIALANKVLPVPGSPNNKTPLCNLAPFILYYSGLLSILIKSSTSDRISSIPFTSLSLYVMSFAVFISSLNFSAPKISLFGLTAYIKK